MPLMRTRMDSLLVWPEGRQVLGKLLVLSNLTSLP